MATREEIEHRLIVDVNGEAEIDWKYMVDLDLKGLNREYHICREILQDREILSHHRTDYRFKNGDRIPRPCDCCRRPEPWEDRPSLSRQDVIDYIAAASAAEGGKAFIDWNRVCWADGMRTFYSLQRNSVVPHDSDVEILLLTEETTVATVWEEADQENSSNLISDLDRVAYLFARKTRLVSTIDEALAVNELFLGAIELTEDSSVKTCLLACPYRMGLVKEKSLRIPSEWEERVETDHDFQYKHRTHPVLRALTAQENATS